MGFFKIFQGKDVIEYESEGDILFKKNRLNLQVENLTSFFLTAKAYRTITPPNSVSPLAQAAPFTPIEVIEKPRGSY